MIAVCRLAILLLVLGTTALATPAPSKPAAAKADDGWITPPQNFMLSRWVCAAGTPVESCKVVIDVPPSPSGKASRPKIAQSCGVDYVDAIAWDYVKTILRQKSALNSQNQQKELRFQVRLSPVALVSKPSSPPPASTMYQGFRTSTPSYPYTAGQRREEGTCRLKVSSAYGKITQVVLLESTGSSMLDANAAVFILSNWAGPKDVPQVSTVVPVTYQLERKPSAKGTMYHMRQI